MTENSSSLPVAMAEATLLHPDDYEEVCSFSPGQTKFMKPRVYSLLYRQLLRQCRLAKKAASDEINDAMSIDDTGNTPFAICELDSDLKPLPPSKDADVLSDSHPTEPSATPLAFPIPHGTPVSKPLSGLAPTSPSANPCAAPATIPSPAPGVVSPSGASPGSHAPRSNESNNTNDANAMAPAMENDHQNQHGNSENQDFYDDDRVESVHRQVSVMGGPDMPYFPLFPRQEATEADTENQGCDGFGAETRIVDDEDIIECESDILSNRELETISDEVIQRCNVTEYDNDLPPLSITPEVDPPTLPEPIGVLRPLGASPSSTATIALPPVRMLPARQASSFKPIRILSAASGIAHPTESFPGSQTPFAGEPRLLMSSPPEASLRRHPFSNQHLNPHCPSAPLQHEHIYPPQQQAPHTMHPVVDSTPATCNTFSASVENRTKLVGNAPTFQNDHQDPHDISKNRDFRDATIPESFYCYFYENLGGMKMKIYFPSNLVPKTVIKVCVPSENDVLKCNGKDNHIEIHNGNMLLKDLVNEKYNDYKDMTNLQKTRLFDSIRGIMKEKHGSKYWKQEEGAWVEMVDDDEISKFNSSKFRNITKAEDRKKNKKRKP